MAWSMSIVLELYCLAKLQLPVNTILIMTRHGVIRVISCQFNSCNTRSLPLGRTDMRSNCVAPSHRALSTKSRLLNLNNSRCTATSKRLGASVSPVVR